MSKTEDELFDQLTPAGRKAYAHDRDVESAANKGQWPVSLHRLENGFYPKLKKK